MTAPSQTNLPGVPGAAPEPPVRVGVVVTGLVLATVVVGVSSTSVASSLPVIMASLGGSQAQYSWVIGATMLSAAATSPLWGKACERVSPRRLVLASLALFVLTSVCGGLMTSAEALIGLRVFQGAGVGGVFTTSTVIVVRIVSARRRAAHLGQLAAAMAVATTAGPVVGGLIADSPLGWRGNFFAGLPLAVVAFVVLVGWLRLPAPTTPARRGFDLAGALLLPAGMAVVLVWLSLGGTTWAWASAGSLVVLATGLVLVALTLVVELRAADPVVPLRLVRRRFVAANLVGVALVPLVGSMGLYLNQFLQLGRGLSATGASLHALPMVLTTAVTSWASGALISRTGRYRGWLLVGSGLLLLGAGALAWLSGFAGLGWVSLAAAAVGCGIGATQQNFLVAAGTGVAANETTALSAIGTSARMLGSAAGIPVLGAVFAAIVRSDIGGRPELAGVDAHVVPALGELSGSVRTGVMEAYQHAFASTVWWCLLPLAVLFLVAVLTPARPLEGEPAPDAEVPGVAPTKHSTP